MVTEIAIGVISLIPAAIFSQKLFDYLNDRLHRHRHLYLILEFEKKEKAIRQFCAVVFFFLWILFYFLFYSLIIL